MAASKARSPSNDKSNIKGVNGNSNTNLPSTTQSNFNSKPKASVMKHHTQAHFYPQKTDYSRPWQEPPKKKLSGILNSDQDID
mmetsp:Transcript_31233/g.28407  ORF Transcript_31233/g.28407 Transcript_31233/m.28407 type:complete len:83 (+) Transcript_31233:54-302(+)